jgi:methylmalonyl-CoA mutase N-terminal domain/subunit
VDVIEFCAKNLPNWEPIEFCGYHIRDSGASAIQEVGIAIANAMEYLDETAARGVDLAELAPHLYMFLSAGLDLFEEVAKFRAARRLWARMLSERYGIDKEMCGLRIFSYTLGSPLTRVEPMNNIIRVAYEALAAVLGGAQTLATSSYDEALGLPSDEAVHLALRTQQILSSETGVRRSTDPLGGSFHVEALTDEVEQRVTDYLAKIAALGGARAVLESGWLANDIGVSAYSMTRDIDSGVREVVGVNKWVVEDESTVQIRPLRIHGDAEARQVARLEQIRSSRDSAAVTAALDRLREVAQARENTLPYVLESVRLYASVGEIVGTLASVWGRARTMPWHLS